MLRKIRNYSYYQFRFFELTIVILLFVKFLLILLNFKNPSIVTGERFACASALLLLINILTNYAILWSWIFIEFAWLYVFKFQNIFYTFYFTLIVLLFIFIYKSNKVIKEHSKKIEKDIEKKFNDDFKMPIWIYFYSIILTIFSITILIGLEYEKLFSLNNSLLNSFTFNKQLLNNFTLKEIIIISFANFVLIFFPFKINKYKNKNLVIFFDGVCLFCNNIVNFIFSQDKENFFRFSPLQSIYAKNNLDESYIKNLNSIVLLIENKTFTKIDAVREILKIMGGVWFLIYLISFIFPKILLNFTYNIFVNKRYKWFGVHRHCPLPSPEKRKYFYD